MTLQGTPAGLTDGMAAHAAGAVRAREEAVRAAIAAGATTWREAGALAGVSHEGARLIAQRLGLTLPPAPPRARAERRPAPARRRPRARRRHLPWDHPEAVARFHEQTLVHPQRKAYGAPELGPCVLWTGRLYKGWGRFSWDGRQIAAHRFAYRLAYGPPRQTLDHLCHTYSPACTARERCLHRSCVNPAHLEDVSNVENLRRGDSHRRVRGVNVIPVVRHACPRGHRWRRETALYDALGRRTCGDCLEGFYDPE